MASLSVVKSTVMLLRRLALFRFVSLFVAFAIDPSSLQHCKALALKFSLFSFTFSFLLQLTITNKQPQEVWATLKSRHPDIEFDAAAVAEHKEKRDKVCIPPFQCCVVLLNPARPFLLSASRLLAKTGTLLKPALLTMASNTSRASRQP
jgi:hypothetical protein